MAIASLVSREGVWVAEACNLNLSGRLCSLVRLKQDRQPLSWRQLADTLLHSPAFIEFWSDVLATPNSLLPDLHHYQWKPVPIHSRSVDLPFFAVLVPTTFASADPFAYQSYFAGLPPGQRVAAFPNLSGHSMLVSPAPASSGAKGFGHLSEFSQVASSELVHEFWQQVGGLARESIQTNQTTWCNTHGHGVPWLHVRFDPDHKYAAFPPFGKITRTSQQEWYAMYRQAFSETITV